MKEYFELQYRMLNRRLKDAGLVPLLAYIVLAVLFTGLSVYLFNKTRFADYAYIMIALVLTGKLSENKRVDFLKLCFKRYKVKEIRIIENLITALPFLLFLLYKQLFPSALILVVLTTAFAFADFRTTLTFVIPTPFYKKPFEFAIGFRNTFYVIAICYSLTIISVLAANFNLGVFSMLLLFALTFTYYLKPEAEYYIWSYSLSPKNFLLEKIKTASVYTAVLVMPIALILGASFHENIQTLLLFMLAGWAFQICMIVGKYAAYPDELNILQGVLLGLCIWFPPLLVLLIPYFFYKSARRLNRLLK